MNTGHPSTAYPNTAYPSTAYGGTAMADETARTITLVVVDDHPVVRDGLRGMFESAPGFEVLGEAADGVEESISPPVWTPTWS